MNLNRTIAKIEEITEVNPRLGKADIPDDLPVSFVPMPAVGAGNGSIDVSQVRPFGEVKKGFTSFKQGDVLFAKITPCMENGKMAVVPEVKNGYGFGSTEFHVLRPKPGVNARYLYFYVSSNRFRGEAEHQMSGAVGQKRVPTQFLRESTIPLAPIKEQTRIVAEIEKQFSRLDEAVANLKRVKANLKRYKAAVLKAAVEGKLTEGTWKPLASAVESIDQGWSPKCDREASANDERWGVIKTTAVQPQCYLEDENKTLPDTLEPRPGLEIKCGDLLITRAGPRGRVGVSCLVKKTRPKLMMCDKVYRLRCKLEVVIPEYMELVLNAPQTVELLDELKTGISDSGVNLTQGRFLAMELPLPSISIQREIVAETERKISILSEIEREFDTNLRRADRLRQSILKQAFSGQLVPQDPNDEPASVLLERIRATQHAQTKEPVARPRKRRTPAPETGAPSPQPLSLVAEAPATYGDAIISRILAAMQPGREYVRADLVEPLGLTTGQWNSAIQELKRRGRVRQVGERRGARYEKKVL